MGPEGMPRHGLPVLLYRPWQQHLSECAYTHGVCVCVHMHKGQCQCQCGCVCSISVLLYSSRSHVREGDSSRLLAEACAQGDWLAVQSLLAQGRGLHEPGEDGESLLSLACSAGYYELVEVLLKMRAGVEDRGLRGEGE